MVKYIFLQEQAPF